MPKDKKKLAIDNPRGNKRGGKKYKKVMQIENDPTWELHLKYHHRKVIKKKDVCNFIKCPMFGKIINN